MKFPSIILASAVTLAAAICYGGTNVYTYMDITGSGAGDGAYVNTGYLPRYDSIIRAKFQVTDNGNQALYCSRKAYDQNAANKLFCYFPAMNSKIRYDYHDKHYAGASMIGTADYPYNADLTLEVKNGVSTLTLDSTGTVIDGPIGPGLKTAFGQSSYPLALLSSFNMSGSDPANWGNCFHGRFYYLQVCEPGPNGTEVLVHDFRPGVADGTTNIFDAVTGATYAMNVLGSGEWSVSGKEYIVYTDSGDYFGRVDGQPHALTVTPFYPTTGVTVEYSTNQANWSATAPSFTEIGSYTVHFRLSADGCDTIHDSRQIVLTAPVICTWTGAGADNLASTAANWSNSALPISGDAVVLDATSAKDVTWDAGMASVKPGAWTQTADYTGTVTFETTYDGIFSKVEMLGDVLLAGGTWKHLANKETYRQYRLYVSVGGDMTIGTAARIDASSLGYTKQYMVSTGTFASHSYKGGTYGGFGGWQNEVDGNNSPARTGILPYGSITAPEDPGSAATTAGGGVIRLDVGGALALEGELLANGKTASYYTGSGGAIYVRAGTITGAGTMTANGLVNNGNNDYSGGSGGRIAIILTGSGANFNAFDPVSQCTAYCNGSAALKRAGAPGTIYAETPDDTPGKGWLIFKDNGRPHLFAANNAYPFTTGVTQTDYARITITNMASIYLPEGTTLDLRTATFDKDDIPGVYNGVYMAGGTLKPAPDGQIDYGVTTSAGLGGLDHSAVTFTSGSRLTIIETDATFTGNMTIADGVSVLADQALTVNGNLTLNGTITRSDGPFNANPPELVLNVTGDLTIGSTGLIDMTGKGYENTRCPLDQTHTGFSGSSHGGRGWSGISVGTKSSVVPYGSITEPVTAGAGGSQSPGGGGVIRMVVGGALAHSGRIVATSSQHSSNDYYHGGGGSINIRTGTISGTGSIDAGSGYQKNAQYGPGGGGRVAVRLTASDADFSNFTGELSARGARMSDTPNAWAGGAGTVWKKSASQGEDGGTLIVDNLYSGLRNWAETTVGGSRVTGNAFGDVIIGSCAQIELAENATMYVSGTLSNGCEFVAQPDSTVTFTGTGESRIFGDVTFVNVTCAEAGKTLTVNDGATITVTGLGSFAGVTGNLVTLRSATAGQAWTLDVDGSVALTGVALRDCQASEAITVVNGQDLGGNSANVSFINIAPGELVTWTGVTDSSWETASNWDRNRTPIATDKVAIPSGCANNPALAVNVEVAELSLAGGATLTLDDKRLKVTGDVTLDGTVTASGGTLATGGDVAFTGSAGVATLNVRLDGTEAQVVAAEDLNVKNLNVANPAVTLSGAITCTEFSAGDGYAAYVVSFSNETALTAGKFAFHGNAATTNGILRCVTEGGTWSLSVNEADVSGATVSGSDASGGVLIVPTDCADGGNNVNWLFVDDRTHWTGAKSSDFADAGNWSDGVPTAEKDAVIEGDVAAVVSSAAAARSLTVASGATLKVNAALATSGSVTVEKEATLEWNRPGMIGGKLVLLSGAKLTHAANSTDEANKIDLAVAGSTFVAPGASICAFGCGYEKNKGPGASGASGDPASHGGMSRKKPGYGSALCPTNCGSGGVFSTSLYTYRGGGAVKLFCGGALTVEGEINVSAPIAEYYTGSGGSIWLKATRLLGAGAIHANGGHVTTYGAGSGGRVALYLTEATDNASFSGTLAAHSGRKCNSAGDIVGSCDSSPGTIYLETAADTAGGGTLTVASIAGTVPQTAAGYRTELPASSLCDPGELRDVRIVGGTSASLSINEDTRVGDIHILSNDAYAKLYLNGHKLRVNSRRHAISPNDATQIIYGEGGEIIWKVPGTMLMLR